MKKIIYTISVLLCFYGSQAQLLSPNKIWSTAKHSLICIYESYLCQSYYTKITGDSVIDGTTWQKVYYSEDALMETWTYDGLVYETNGKIYGKDLTASDKTCLLYDFTCNVGDTLKLDCYCEDYPFVVDSIGKTSINKDLKKIYYLRYALYDPGDPHWEIWIEGVGSLTGIINGGDKGYCSSGSAQALLCCYENDKLLYKNKEFENCYYQPTGIDETTQLNKISISPNPFTSQGYIDLSGITFSKAKLEIYNVHGQMVREVLNIQKPKIPITKGNLPLGFYLAKLTVDNGDRVYLGKFVVE